MILSMKQMMILMMIQLTLTRMEVIDHVMSMRCRRMVVQLVKLVDLELVVPIRCCSHLEIHNGLCVKREGIPLSLIVLSNV